MGYFLEGKCWQYCIPQALHITNIVFILHTLSISQDKDMRIQKSGPSSAKYSIGNRIQEKRKKSK